MIGFPLDSRVTYEADGTPSYDRAIGAEPYRKLLKELFNTGVLPTVSTNMQVVSGTGLSVTVKAGFAIVEGCMKLEEADKSITLDASDTTYARIDTIVLRLNDNEDVRSCEYAVIKGTPASTPVAPSLVRTNSIYDIGLANIKLNANSTIISQANITDTRYDSTRCGVMSAIAEFDTTTLYAQIESDLNTFQTVNEANFTTWVESIKDILDAETAGHLQLEIEELQGSVGWKGTWSEFESQRDTLAEGTMIDITDDYASDICPTIADCIASTSTDDVAGAGAIVEVNNKCNQINNNLTYSTTEVKTSATWLDGKPIYRRTLSLTTTSSSVNANQNISSWNIDRIICGSGCIDIGAYYLPLSSATDGYTARWDYKKTTSIITLMTVNGWTGTAYITLEYTKTTD